VRNVIEDLHHVLALFGGLLSEEFAAATEALCVTPGRHGKIQGGRVCFHTHLLIENVQNAILEGGLLTKY
jgi:hypothetical protein